MIFVEPGMSGETVSGGLEAGRPGADELETGGLEAGGLGMCCRLRR